MPRHKGLKRKEFIRLTLMSAAGIYLNSCQTGTDTKVQKDHATKDTAIKDTVAAGIVEPNTEPTYQLYKKGDVQYDVLRKGFNKRIDKYPAAIIVCKTTEEVSGAVAYGIKNKLPISIKSGGHSFEGYSCNDDGLVINVSSMKEITWHNENTISVGSGCTLSQLYGEIFPKKKLLPAGSCGSVGIGGLTLGGGYGLFSRKYGLTCDSLSEVTMVDGKGNIINSKDDPELLWACKGGGNGNFGVITSMKFSLNDAPGFLQSFRFKIKITDAARALNILEKWFAITGNLPLSCFSAFVLNGKSLYILLTNCESKNEETQKIIDQLSALADKTTAGPPTGLSRAVKVFYGNMSPLYFKNASAGFYKNFDDIKAFIAPILEKVINSRGMIYQVNTLGGKINDQDLAKQSSFSQRDKNYLSELQTYWNAPSRIDQMTAAFEELQEIFYANGIRAQYGNYPDIHFKDWEIAYYGENYQRLQKIKSKYDPLNYFRYEQSVKPL